MEVVMKRSTGIDLLKTIAIFCVIVIHTCSYSQTGFDWYASVFWGSLTRMAVPVFFMCSGALLLDPERSFSPKKFFKKNFLRVFIALIVWAAVYKLLHLVSSGNLNGPSVLYALKELVLFRHEDHFYYLHILLLLYAFVPVLRVLTKYAGKRCLTYLLALWALLGIVYPTVKAFWPFSLLGGIPAQWLINMTYASFGYAILGYYLRTYPIRKSTSVLLYLLGFTVTFAGTVLMSLRSGGLYTGFLEGMSIGVALEAAGLFGLFIGFDAREKAAGFLEYTSRSTLCVYAVHMLVLKGFGRLGLSVIRFSSLISVPLLSLLNLVICLGVYFVLSRIPFIKKYLV